MAKNSQAKIKANNKYKNSHYERAEIFFPVGQKDIIKEYAKNKGMSLNAYINSLIASDMGELLPEVKKEDKE